jgi:hypothetical protein
MVAAQVVARPKLFNPRLYEEPRSFTVVRRALLTLFSIHICFATFAGYRAIVQVKSLELDAPAEPLREGSAITAHGVSWNRTWVTLRLMLEQGTVAETLGVHVINTSWIASWNPIPQHGEITVHLDPEMLAHFQSGAATLRATAIGRPQWMRTPPPTVRSIPVQLVKP